MSKAELKNKEVSDKFELAFPDEQKDVRVVPNKYNGLLSGIIIDAAEAYIQQGGNLLRLKEKRHAAGTAGKEISGNSTSANSK
jgi:hypothetical protein